VSGGESGLRVAVIGAGIVGSSCALFLQRDGHDVTLIDPVPPGAGTSSGNAGIISVSSILPIATPGILRRVPALLRDPTSPLAIRWRYLPALLPWLARFALASRPARFAALTDALATLIREADRAHDLVIQQCGLAGLVRSGGWLTLARSPERLLDATASQRQAFDRYDIDYELLLDAAEVRALEPALAPDLTAGLLIPGNRAVRSPRGYVEGIARTVTERGGRWLQARALRFVHDGDRVTAVVTDRGEVPADAVVLAAGAFSKGLAASAGARVPLEAERGYHVVLPHPEPTLSRPVYSVEGGFVLAPMEDGVRLTGGVELASPTAPPDFRRVRRLVEKARAMLPGLDGRTLSEWQGCRPSLPDSLPVLGRAPGRSNLFLAFGHQHVGLTLGPVTGRIVADLVAGREPGIDLGPYAAGRRFF
jgi:D-amino-acid dehydrogenase